MSISRRQLLQFAGTASLLSAAPSLALAQKLEKASVHIAVGGKVGTYYQSLTIAEQLGFFKDEGLDIKISDFAGGSKSLQAVVGEGQASWVASCAGGRQEGTHIGRHGMGAWVGSWRPKEAV